MAEIADPSVNPPSVTPSSSPAPETELAAPVAELKLATRRTRERMSANLNALERKVRAAVGGDRGDMPPSAGQRRLLNTVSAAATVRRLRALPFRTVAAIGIVTACVVALGVRRSRR